MSFSIKLDSRQNVVFASDFHFNHNRDFIFKARGFDDVAAHNAFLLKQLSVVDPNTVLVYLGDFALNVANGDVAAFLSKLPFSTIYYTLGNHDNNFLREVEQFRHGGLNRSGCYYDVQFPGKRILVSNAFEFVYRKQYICCQHFPQFSWNHCADGAWALCGHEHGNIRELNPDGLACKRLDVGVDNALKFASGKAFFTFDELNSLFLNQKSLGHH